MNSENQNSIEAAQVAIAGADALLVTAGAGIGVDSGLPDFRGNEGFWKAYPPIAKLGISFSQMANPQWFEQRPRLAWAFYGHRLNLYRQTVPHSGFQLLLDLGGKMPNGYFVFSSNVDGQFQKAGFSKDRIEECHGSIHHLQCVNSCTNDIWSAADELLQLDEDRFEAVGGLPRCRNCGGLARPNILMFGDWGWIGDRSNEQSARLGNWMAGLRRQKAKLLVIEMGAGEALPTVRMQSENAARALGGKLIRINPRDYHVPAGQISIPLGAETGVKAILANS
jgi:NAD-dependent SIR2 family protein deacetylase